VELYRPDGIPVVFDLQIEAEVLGCRLAWSKENPPAVISHPLAEGVLLSQLQLPEKTDGRFPVELEAASILRERYPDLALYGLITGPFTLALHLMGTEIFMNMFEEPGRVNEVMDFCTRVAIRHAGMLLEAGCDVIAVVDPMTSQIDPDSFQTFVSPSAGLIFDYVRSKDKLSSFFVCGHAQQNIEVMCDCGPDNISIDENIPLNYVKAIALEKGISFGGNLKLTSVLLLGNEQDSRKEAVDCLDLGGNRGFILAPGCDLPMDTPVKNLQAVTGMVYDAYERQVVREMAHNSSLEPLDLTGHWTEGKVVIDVITLDSSSCAPCQYMMEAVRQAASGFGDKVVVNEYKIKEKDGIRMMLSLAVQNVPTTCINGKVAFISQIPPKTEIIKAIENAL
jgi:uroporphyrinogen decarboxylase